MLDTLAIISSVNSGHGRPEVVCHLLSSCVHTSITSKRDPEVFEMSDKFQRHANPNSQNTSLKRSHETNLVSKVFAHYGAHYCVACTTHPLLVQ